MKTINRWAWLTLLALFEGLAALIFYFRIPSESVNSGLLGYSTSRWLIGAAAVLICFILSAVLIYSFIRRPAWLLASQKVNRWLESGDHIWAVRVLILAGLLTCLEVYLLSYLSWPIHLRPLIIWLALVLVQGLIWSFWFFHYPLNFFVKWHTLDRQQRWILLTLAVMGLLFFCLIIPPNLRGAETPHIFNVAVNDENITYLPVQWMLKLTGKPEEWIYGLIVYEDYHYGYPFYFLSALVLLPARLIWGADFADHTQTNLLFLRLLISSLPILVSTLLLVWMNTRFRSWWKSILLFDSFNPQCRFLPGAFLASRWTGGPDRCINPVLFVTRSLPPGLELFRRRRVLRPGLGHQTVRLFLFPFHSRLFALLSA
jgi:hypothetical protein